MEATVAKAQSQLERVAVVALGWVFICLGIVGLVLPIVPGAASYSCWRPHGESPMCVVAANAGNMSSAVSRPSARL